MRNRRGFTLIEMLVVVIIIGVVLAIAVPSVSNLVSSRGKKMYDQQIKLIEKAVNGYTLKYKGEIIDAGDKSCYVLPYQKLLNYELITETDIKCSGNIILNKNGNDYTPSYYLTCVDEDGTAFSEANTLPTGCTIIN